MNMKVSSLFNGKEFQKELDKIKQYMNMLGQSDRKIIITLDNDIGTDGEIYDRAKFDVKRNETIRSELSKKVPGYELQFIEVKEDGIIITGVNGGKAKRVNIPIPKISDSVLLEIYANSIFKTIEKWESVVLEYFGIVIKDGEVSCI